MRFQQLSKTTSKCESAKLLHLLSCDDVTEISRMPGRLPQGVRFRAQNILNDIISRYVRAVPNISLRFPPTHTLTFAVNSREKKLHSKIIQQERTSGEHSHE